MELLKLITESMANIGSKTLKFRDKLGSLGAMDVLFIVIQNHFNNVVLVEKACITYKLIASSKCPLKTNLSLVCEIMTSTIRLHMNCIAVVREGCNVMRILITQCNYEDHKMNCRLGTCDLIVEIIKKYITNALIVESGCVILQNMSESFNIELISNKWKLCEVLVSLLKTCMNNTNLVEVIMMTIRNLSLYPDNHDKLGELCDHITSVIKRHMKNLMIVELSFEVVKNIAVYEDNQERLGRF